ncbi:MAG: hypothetical protein P8Z37_05070 [Acidobacteriota bacterium]
MSPLVAVRITSRHPAHHSSRKVLERSGRPLVQAHDILPGSHSFQRDFKIVRTVAHRFQFAFRECPCGVPL